ncbi:MAG: MFS transporter [Polyangiaceae bacterium]|nr:MFS transporter [Polyangiaceae bacterium]
MKPAQVSAAGGERVVTRRFALATLANLVFFVAVTAFFSLPVHLEALGGSRADIGRVMGVFGLACLLAIPLTGALADRFGRQRFMFAGALLWVGLALGFSAVDRVGPLVYGLRLGQGVAFSLAFVATNATIVDLAPAGALGRAIAWFGATTLISHAVGPSLGEWVAHELGFRALFLLSAAVAFASLPLYLAVPDVPRSPAELGAVDTGASALLFRRGGVGPVACALGTAVTFGTALNFMPVFVRARGLPSHAPFFVTYVVAAILVRLVAGGLGDRVGHRRVGLVGAAGFALAAVGFGFVRASWQLIVVSLAFGLAHGLAYPAMNAAFVGAAPARARGRAMALFNLSFNLGVTLSAFVAGEVAERFDYRVMWAVSAAVSLVGALVFLADRPRVSAAGRA